MQGLWGKCYTAEDDTVSLADIMGENVATKTFDVPVWQWKRYLYTSVRQTTHSAVTGKVQKYYFSNGWRIRRIECQDETAKRALSGLLTDASQYTHKHKHTHIHSHTHIKKHTQHWHR